MNTISIDFKPFVEWDNSPFILFDHQGKIVYLNNAAEILFGHVTPKEIYDIAVAYAPQNFGFMTTTVSLNYDAFSFYALTVGYENDDQIAIRLYNKPRIRQNIPIQKDKLITTDINILLEANIALFKTKNQNSLTLLTDQEIPRFKIDQNNFSKLLRKTLDSFRASDSIAISLRMLIGEHIIIAGKRESMVQLRIEANGRYVDHDDEIKALTENTHIACSLKERSIKLDIPLIQ
ncbi:MAG: hypothetical protein IE885_05430 [Campylobacterales bacterium]|nr:hypothetical protein [Campylobacterales bacterium]